MEPSTGDSVQPQDTGTGTEEYELPMLEIFKSAFDHKSRDRAQKAIIDVKERKTYTYELLLLGAAILKKTILDWLGLGDVQDLEDQRVAFLAPSGFAYVQIQWGIWAAGGVAVPLCTSHPFQELQYVVSDSEPSLIILHEEFMHHLPSFQATFPGIQIKVMPKYNGNALEFKNDQNLKFSRTVSIDPSRRALIIYTSGTTSKPKGCVSTHSNILFQAKSLVNAWSYSSSDRLIHVLPLHHVHGIVNGLTATLIAGGTVEMHPKFDASVVWKRWKDGDSTMFMAVPTVYSRLNSYFDQNIKGTTDESQAILGAQALRLVVSGSAALPTSVKQRFREITGQTLLERYGMTEIGMALSCQYDNANGQGRPDGSVGWPLDGVQVRLAKGDGDVVTSYDDDGEIQIKGPNVFKEYWKKPEATKQEFTEDGYFKTGDIAYRSQNGAYFIRGRSSVDIIKSGGYKISALDVEREILSHVPGVKEVAIVGVPDEEWGQRVGAVISFEDGSNVELKELRTMLRSYLAAYKLPTLLEKVQKIERNAMGKINKKQLVREIWPESDIRP